MFQCSSASRKFLKILRCALDVHVAVFQCSSASRKFLKFGAFSAKNSSALCFSALQRAENSSNSAASRSLMYLCDMFQCSSASRKFLKSHCAEQIGAPSDVSVLFSEPKIPQIRMSIRSSLSRSSFSALQRAENSSNLLSLQCGCGKSRSFSALQRAENSSNSLPVATPNV